MVPYPFKGNKGREKMNYRITNGSISYGAETILEEINFEIKEKDKIAIPLSEEMEQEKQHF